MDIELSKVINGVRFAVAQAASKSASKRLLVLQDSCSCKPGCHSCCYRMIYINVAEALIIYENLKESKNWENVRVNCIALIDTTKKSSPLSWFKMRIECPILDTNTKMCTAYGVRPPPCSTHFVKSDPSGCDPWSLKSIKYENASMSDLYEEFEKNISNSIDGHGILGYKFPIPIALLFAERINTKKNMQANDIVSFIYNELK